MARSESIHHDAPASLRKQCERDRFSLVLTRDAVREVDRAAIEDYAIPGIVLMENAARGLAEAAVDMLDRGRLRNQESVAGDEAAFAALHTQPSPHVLIVCGGGNNGGDGYALARHLHNAGAACTLLPISEPKPGTDSASNREICRRMKMREVAVDERASLDEEPIDLIVDAIFGTGLDREVTGTPSEMIEWINQRRVPVLAVDVPSGLDCDTGKIHGTSVRASMTVTFVALKPAFQQLDAQKLLGEVRIADIGVPRELAERHGQRLPAPRGVLSSEF